MNLTKDKAVLVSVEMTSKKGKKNILTNVACVDFVVSGKWDTRKVSKNFVKKLVNAEVVDKHYVNGKFILEAGKTRKLKRSNFNELLDKLPLAGYNTMLKKDKTKMFIVR